MSTLLTQIDGIASLGSLILSRDAVVLRGSTTHPVRASRLKSQKPYRANETGRSSDASFRLHAANSPVEPFQNDILVFEGEEWIVWRITPSAAGSHWVLDCMAPPTIAVVPIARVNVDDGQGGSSHLWIDQVDSIFYAKVREASQDRQLTAVSETAMGRLAMSYRSADVPEGFWTRWRVRIGNDPAGYEILSITVDDENPLWRNAVLVKEG